MLLGSAVAVQERKQIGSSTSASWSRLEQVWTLEVAHTPIVAGSAMLTETRSRRDAHKKIKSERFCNQAVETVKTVDSISTAVQGRSKEQES